jgi:WD40 repeat protein
MIKVTYLKIKKDKNVIVTCVDNKNINIFNMCNKTISSKITITDHTNIITCTCISNDQSVIVYVSENKTIKVWNNN